MGCAEHCDQNRLKLPGDPLIQMLEIAEADSALQWRSMRAYRRDGRLK